MAEGSHATDSVKKPDNSRIMSALITGAFGLVGTVATVFAVRQDPPPPAPTHASLAATPSAVVQPSLLPQPPAAEPMVSAPSSAPNLLLNFAAFQKKLATSDVGIEERKQMVRSLLNQHVIWKGYVDAIIPMTSPTSDAAVTVSLVESLDKVGQSMFKTPAHFRFGPDALDAISGLVPGDHVTLTGTLTSHTLIASDVRQAGLLKINSLPAARSIAAPETNMPR